VNGIAIAVPPSTDTVRKFVEARASVSLTKPENVTLELRTTVVTVLIAVSVKLGGLKSRPKETILPVPVQAVPVPEPTVPAVVAIKESPTVLLVAPKVLKSVLPTESMV
jgi:hypothetical protein